MAKRNKRNQPKVRNWHALNAIQGCKAHRFIDRKKEARKRACRGRVRDER